MVQPAQPAAVAAVTIRRHLQQGHGHFLGQPSGVCLTLAMGHPGYSRVVHKYGDSRSGRATGVGKHIKIVQVDETFRAEIFQRIGSHRARIDQPIPDRSHDLVMGFIETQFPEVAMRIDPVFLELPPGHEPSAQ
jgi:hypothetical protein